MDRIKFYTQTTGDTKVENAPKWYEDQYLLFCNENNLTPKYKEFSHSKVLIIDPKNDKSFDNWLQKKFPYQKIQLSSLYGTTMKPKKKFNHGK